MFRTPTAVSACPNPADAKTRHRFRPKFISVPFAALAAVLMLLGVSAPAQAAPAPAVVATADSAYGDSVVGTAASFAGTPYKYGGASPAGFDCSGFVGHVYRIHGKALPRTAAQIRAAVPTISRAQAGPGDLVFVHRGGRISHVGIVAADGRWWEATRPGRALGLHQPWASNVSFGRP